MKKKILYQFRHNKFKINNQNENMNIYFSYSFAYFEINKTLLEFQI